MVIDESIDQLREKIDQAKQWARTYFNADACQNTKLVNEDMTFVKPSHFVDFPGADMMEVCPSFLGQRGGFKFTYRLAFVGDVTRWKFQKLEIHNQLVPKNFHRPIADLDVN